MGQFLSAHKTSYKYGGWGYGEVQVDNATLGITLRGLDLGLMVGFLSVKFGFNPESQDLGLVGDR